MNEVKVLYFPINKNFIRKLTQDTHRRCYGRMHKLLYNLIFLTKLFEKDYSIYNSQLLIN